MNRPSIPIEQTLMRSIKSSGGLTRGRGFDEGVRQLWALSSSSSAHVHSALMELIGTFFIPVISTLSLVKQERILISMIAKNYLRG